MDTSLLLTWLGLPPGNWPPEDRLILGLPPAPTPVSATEAEQQALGRMEKLRPHQLKHPELVTEGMNRLAQALIAVMSTASSSREPVAAAPPPPPRPRRPAKTRSKPKLEPLPEPLPEVEPLQLVELPLPLPPPEPEVLDAEVVLDPVAVSSTRVDLPVAAVRTVPISAPVTVPEPPEGTNYFPKERRKGYRELVFLRRLRLAWGLLKRTIGDANEPLTSAEAIYEFLCAVRDLAGLREREEFERVIRGDAVSVASVVAQPAALTILRELVASQRWGLAVSWDAGRLAIERREKWLRERMRDSKPLRRSGSNDGELGSFLRSNPEWILMTLSLIVMVIGVLRSIARNNG